MVAEICRQVIFAVVWIVLIIRTPFMVRDKQQRPLWLVLVVIALGSIMIQSWFGEAINSATGIAGFNNLVQGVFAVLDVAVLLEFVVLLTQGENAGVPRRWRIGSAVTATVIMTISFAFTGSAQRFKPLTGISPFVGYVLAVGIYTIAASALAAYLMFRYLPRVPTKTRKTLYAGLLMVALGNLAEVGFMGVRTVYRWAAFTTATLDHTGFILSMTRFILVPLGCAIAAFEPTRRALLYYYRRIRLFSFWTLLSAATPDITLRELPSRPLDLFTIDTSANAAYDHLHQRVVDIRDSIFHLFDRWATQNLVNLAAQQAKIAESAARPHRRHIFQTACWLEVVRREALAGVAPRDEHVTKSHLPEIRADEATMHTEVTLLLRLHRTLRSPEVQTFAEHTAQKPTTLTA